MIKDTVYNLEIRLQRVDTSLGTDSTSADTIVDLQDERAVIGQCLRVCQDALFESLQHGQAFPRQDVTSSHASTTQSQLEAEGMTTQALNESRHRFIPTIDHLQERLAPVASNKGAEREHQMSGLHEDFSLAKQCLEICQMATDQVHHTADDDTDQVVVTTFADLFNVREVSAKCRTASVVGSLSDDTLLQISRDHRRVQTEIAATSSNSGVGEDSIQRPDPVTKHEQPVSAAMAYSSPSPNEAGKRDAEDESGYP